MNAVCRMLTRNTKPAESVGGGSRLAVTGHWDRHKKGIYLDRFKWRSPDCRYVE